MAKKAKKKKSATKKKAVKRVAKPKRVAKLPAAPVTLRTVSARPSVSAKPKKVAEVVKEYKPAYASVGHLKPKKSKPIVIGTWALILAVIVSVMLALIETPYLPIILVVVGFAVGFLNFEHEETVKFLVSTVSMLIIASALLLTGFSRLEIIAPVVALYLERASYNVISVVAPAAFVISLKALRELAE